MFGKTVNKIKHKADEGKTIQCNTIQETCIASESSGNLLKDKRLGIAKPFRKPIFTNCVERGGSAV